MTNKDTILKTVTFIENNLRSEIGLIDIAREGCYSLYHFIRLFQSITGISPGKYLLNRRLTEAANALRGKENSIADIAYEFQFGSHEAFTRAFRKNLGIKPSQVRQGHPLSSLNLTPPISAEFIYQSDKARNQPPEIVELDQRYLAGIAFFIRDDEKISDLSLQWGQMIKEVKKIEDRLLPERFYQVQYWSGEQELGGLYFYIGVEVKSIERVKPEFVVKVIPKGKYLKFIHKGLARNVGYTYRYIYCQYLPDTDHKLTQPFNFEFYGDKCLGPDNEQSESEIYIPLD